MAGFLPSRFQRPLRSYLRKRDGWSGVLRGHATAQSYLAPQIASAYGLPANLDGSGVTVGIIELGGGFSQADYNAAMTLYGKVTQQVMEDGSSQPDPGGADVEVMLDSCVIGGIAPRAKQIIINAPNSALGIAQGINRGVQLGCDVLSLSWGGPEDTWDQSSRQATDAAAQQAASLLINLFVASGDNGSGDGEAGNNVDYPSSSPWAVGCGGTTLLIQNGIIVSETTWPNTGGGESAVYPMPAFQKGLVNGSQRGVPDVAGNADPETGWIIVTGGQEQSVGGTSAVAPMWAAINALMIQANGGKRLSWLNPLFYANIKAFRDTITGSNGTFSAGPGYDMATGLGSPGPQLIPMLVGGIIPPQPPPTPVAPLFVMNFSKPVRQNVPFVVRGPHPTIPAGKYGVVPLTVPADHVAIPEVQAEEEVTP